MKFVDLFAGLGGFHLALASLGHRCVFACELDEDLRELYFRNFGLLPAGDIRDIATADVPAHDVLCAGFPCQPFSKAGGQEGFSCPKNGDLFAQVMRVVRARRPRYLLLENVANLKMHDGGDTWAAIYSQLTRAGYSVTSARLSPHRFGIPQIRDRLFIVASVRGLDNFTWPEETALEDNIDAILDRFPTDARPLSENVIKCIDVWQDFLERLPRNVALPAGPLWSMEFGATYPFTESTPHAEGRRLGRYKGSFGQMLSGADRAKDLELLPSHARSALEKFPAWKVRFIKNNREFYQANRKWIKPWLPSIATFPSSLQKLEWTCRGEVHDMWKHVIQFRASGVRVKRRTTSPSLVSMTTTQVPIIGWERRYITPRECARLQSLDGLRHLPANRERAYASLGNAVNARVVTLVAARLLGKQLSTSPKSMRGRCS